MCLKRHVEQNYYDHKIQFIHKAICQIDYFDKIPRDILFDLYYSLKPKIFERGETVLLEGSVIDSIYFILEGTVEVYSQFEYNEFKIEQLGPGSVLNYRSVFIND